MDIYEKLKAMIEDAQRQDNTALANALKAAFEVAGRDVTAQSGNQTPPPPPTGGRV